MELKEQGRRRCAGPFFCINSHVSPMCRSGRWSGAKTPTDPENGGLDSKSQLQMVSCSETDFWGKIFYLFPVDLVSLSDDSNSLTGSDELIKSALFMPQLLSNVCPSVITCPSESLPSPQWPLLVLWGIPCLHLVFLSAVAIIVYLMTHLASVTTPRMLLAGDLFGSQILWEQLSVMIMSCL